MTTKKEILLAIREHCLECCSGSWKEVEMCSYSVPFASKRRCKLWPYRFGKDPNPARRGENLKKYAESKKD